MPIITLTSDWQNDSIYLAIIKGFILKNSPISQIIDLSHKISFMNIGEAAFIIRNSYKQFPDGTIHIIAVNSEASETQNHLIVEANNQYFISNDNGIFNLIFEEPVDNIIEIKNTETLSPTFPELNIFAKTACDIANGQNISEFGEGLSKFNKFFPLLAYTEEDIIEGKIVFIDNYKNLITNISKELFENIRKDRDFVITLKSIKHKIKIISKNYNEIEEGELLAIFNSFGYMELAQAKGRLAELLQVSVKDTVRVRFGMKNDELKMKN